MFCFNFLDELLNFRNRNNIDKEKDSSTETRKPSCNDVRNDHTKRNKRLNKKTKKLNKLS